MKARPSEGTESTTLTLDSPVSRLPRCGALEARRLEKLGVRTVRDLLLTLPFGWDNYGAGVSISELRPGERATVVATIDRIAARRSPRQQKPLTEARLVDDDGAAMKVVWFNQPYLARELRSGERIRVAGRVRE